MNAEGQNGAFYTYNVERSCLFHNCWTKCLNVGGDYVETTAFDFLKLTPSSQGHGLINHPLYSSYVLM